MKFIKYFFVGGIAALVDFLIFALFVKVLEQPWFISGITGFVLATLVNYLLSIRHVFTSGARFKKHKEIMLVFFVSFIGLIVNQLILWQCIDFLLLDPLIAKVTATGIVFFWNYAARNHFIFKAYKGSVKNNEISLIFSTRILGLSGGRCLQAVILIIAFGIASIAYVYQFSLNTPLVYSDYFERIKLVYLKY
jgi:putative flippase GtrA